MQCPRGRSGSRRKVSFGSLGKDTNLSAHSSDETVTLLVHAELAVNAAITWKGERMVIGRDSAIHYEIDSWNQTKR